MVALVLCDADPVETYSSIKLAATRIPATTAIRMVRRVMLFCINKNGSITDVPIKGPNVYVQSKVVSVLVDTTSFAACPEDPLTKRMTVSVNPNTEMIAMTHSIGS